MTLDNYIAGEYDQLKWYKDGEEVVGAYTPTLTLENIAYADSGSYYCEITNNLITDMVLKSGEINIHVENVTGITTYHHNEIKVYPNPVADQLFVESNKLGNIIIVDLSGRILLQKEMNGYKEVIDVSDYLPGMYFLKFISEELTTTDIFIKK